MSELTARNTGRPVRSEEATRGVQTRKSRRRRSPILPFQVNANTEQKPHHQRVEWKKMVKVLDQDNFADIMTLAADEKPLRTGANDSPACLFLSAHETCRGSWNLGLFREARRGQPAGASPLTGWPAPADRIGPRRDASLTIRSIVCVHASEDDEPLRGAGVDRLGSRQCRLIRDKPGRAVHAVAGRGEGAIPRQRPRGDQSVS
jgi:hypothetical protein